MPAHTSYTAKLSDDWDLQLDGNGNVETCRKAEAICQNVCNECRLFRNDAYFRYGEGIAWFSDQLGKPLQKVVTESRLREAALAVKGVLAVQSIELRGLDSVSRKLTGTLRITTEEGDDGRIEL